MEMGCVVMPRCPFLKPHFESRLARVTPRTTVFLRSAARMESSAAANDTANSAQGTEADIVVQYVVLRRDLIDTWPLGSVVTQGCHASVAAIWTHKDDPDTLSYCAPPNLDSMHKVTLEVKGETQLLNLSEKLKAGGIAHKLWIEQPENFSTCLATKPYPKSAVSSYFKKLKLYDLTHANVIPTNTNTPNGPKGWTDEEDMALMYAWVSASQNPIVSTNQYSQTFWKRIWEMYHKSRALHPQLMGDERSIESLRNRHKRLNTNVTKWVAVYKEAYSRKSNGMLDADVEKEAQKLYSSGKSTKFTHHEVFERIMRHHPKWELKLGVERHRTRVEYADAEEDHESSKKSRTTGQEDDSNISTSETHAIEVSTICRPSGDKAKAKRKEKVIVSRQSVIPDVYTAELQAMRITREKEVETINRMGNVRLLNTLLGKSNLSAQEESLKNRLMVELFP